LKEARFLIDIFSDEKIKWADEFKVDSMNFSDLIVYREFNNIDILLVTNSFVIAIENKMLSKEHDSQLGRYREIINKLFPDRDQAFIFLTLHGDEAKELSDKEVYVDYSYENISYMIKSILDVYKASLSEKTYTYIEDYYKTIRREVMQEGEEVRIARELYDNHKEAIDFIIENKPDKLLKVMPIAVEAIKNCGYLPETQNKGYARFLPKELDQIIPRSGYGGWKNQEAFLFEISMWSKNIVLKTVIGPGDKDNREVLRKALIKVPGAIDAKTKMWNTIHSIKKVMNVQSDKYDDLDLLKTELCNFIKEQKSFIDKVTEEILKVKEEFKKNSA